MGDEATEQITVQAPADRCLAVVADFERYPEWARDVRHVAVLERDDAGRGVRVEFEVAALGRRLRYVLGYDWSRAPGELSWTLAEGDAFRRLDGSYRFEPDGDDARPATRVVYRLAVDLTLPLPGLLRRKAAALVTGTALRGLKDRVEHPPGA